MQLTDAQRKLLIRLLISHTREREHDASILYSQTLVSLTPAGADSWHRKATDTEKDCVQARELAALIEGAESVTVGGRIAKPERCDECGTELHEFASGDLSGLSCDTCGWSWDA